MSLDPNDPTQVAYNIARLTDLLEERSGDYAEAIRYAAESEADYKRDFAIALVAIADSGVKMPVAEKEARSMTQTHDKHRAYLISAATAKSVKESLSAISTQIHALQSLSASLRGQS